MFVYFDLDDTLFDHRHAEREALADVRNRYVTIFGTLSVDELQAQYRSISEPLWRRYAEGDIDKETLKQRRFEALLESVDAPHADPTLVRRYYIQQYGQYWRLVPGAEAAYEAIAEDVPVGVMTNGFAEVQARKFEAFPVLKERADAIVVCEEEGVLKPDAEAFAHAREQAGVSADQVLYVGDSYQSDVKGAQAAGWRVAWFAPDGPDGRTTDDRGFVFEDWSTLSERVAKRSAQMRGG